MTLSDISIRKPVFAWMLMAALIIFGGLCFSRMGVSQLPDIDFPVVSVNLSLEGAAPEVMEVDVVDPIEDALMSIQGITSISSSSRTGSASITLEFELNKNIDVAVQEVQTILGQVARRLPKELDPPSIRKTNPEDQPILWLAVSSSKMQQRDLMVLVRDQVKDRFSTISGVGEVHMGGYVDPALRVWLSAKKLDDYVLTVSDVLNTIQQEHSEQPSGRIESPERELNIRTMGEAPSAAEFSRLTINKRGGSPNFAPIQLGKIAQIEDGLADVRRKTRSNGMAAIGLGIKKQRGANAVEVAKLVKERMAEVQSILPAGVTIGLRSDSTRFIKESVHELNFTLLLSAILTALICWLFLGSWSATLNVILAIPTSIIGTFMVLYALGFTLNTFTLLALSLAIGIVVDDAIMVLENIVRHKEGGKSRLLSAQIGAREITFSALAATAAIIAIFLPVAFMKGIIGKFFFQFGVTLSVAVALSLLEALTLTPMRCSQFLQIGERRTVIGRLIERGFRASSELYRRILGVVLNHRFATVFASLIFFVLTALFGLNLNREFVPAQDQSRLLLRIQTPVGTSMEITEKKLLEVESIIKTVPEIGEFFAAIGGGGPGGADVNVGTMFLELKPPAARRTNPKTGRPYTQQEMIGVLRAELKQVKALRVVIQDPSLAGFAAKRGFPIEFAVRGPNWETLVDSSQKLMDAMAKTGSMSDIDSDYRSGLPEIRVIPDRQKARERGVSISEIGNTVNALMGGVIAGKFSRDGHRYDVRVRLRPEERSRAEDIRTLRVRNNRGELISLADLVQLKEQKSLQMISRQDRERAVTVFANIAPNNSQAKAIETVRTLAREILPQGYHVVMSGSAKTFGESMASLIFALVLGLLVSYMVLASQFNSFIHPVTILMALPFSVSGAFVSLYLGGQSLNIYSMIGLILLMGIVKKNSILLVDFTNQMRESGLNTREALVEACPMRLRPILMTSLATIAGAIPPALAIGPGAESRIPMALAVIGGVFVSTLLTLLVVPCVYSFFAGFSKPQTPPTVQS